MQKWWFCTLCVLLLGVLPLSVYSYLPESEKSKFEICPLKTYVNVTGDGVHDIGCMDIVNEKGYNNIYINLDCDDGKDSVVAYVNLEKNKLGGNAKREGKFWKLYDFKLRENPFLLKCVKNKTLLEDQIIWVYIRPRFELEADITQKEIREGLNKIGNTTEKQTYSLINETDKILSSINKSITTIENINKTSTQIKTNLTTNQKIQDCKEKYGLLPLFLLLIYEFILGILGLVNKNKKKLILKLLIIGIGGILIIPITQYIVSQLCQSII